SSRSRLPGTCNGYDRWNAVAAAMALRGDLSNDATRVSRRERACGHITRHDASGADDAPRSDGHAGENDRAAADPHVGADRHRPPELTTASQLRIHRVRGRVDLHGRSDQGVASDDDGADVKDDAVEVEEHPLAQSDVQSVVAEERRLDPRRIAARAEQLGEDPTPQFRLILPRRIQLPAQAPRPAAEFDEFAVERIVELPGNHAGPFRAVRFGSPGH